MNANFMYLYRDAGNYKKFGETIFANKNNHSAKFLEKQIQSALISHEFFWAEKSKLPYIGPARYSQELDHGWYELDRVELTDDRPDDEHGRDIDDFIAELGRDSKGY